MKKSDEMYTSSNQLLTSIAASTFLIQEKTFNLNLPIQDIIKFYSCIFVSVIVFLKVLHIVKLDLDYSDGILFWICCLSIGTIDG